MAKPDKVVRLGGATAFYEDSFDGHPALLRAGVDYLVYDYLAELTMAVLAMGPDGFHAGFLRDIKPYLREILDRRIRIVTNWGGMNPEGAARALRTLVKSLDKTCSIAVVRGDDLRDRLDDPCIAEAKEMFSGAAFPKDRKIGSINAYFGAFPIASALAAGADIVVTGRVVDSALSLGPLIHEFGWSAHDYDRLSAGTLIGHLLECSTQVTGGTFTDWEAVPNPADIGNPIAECRADGSFILTKPPDTGGLVSVGTVAEQMIYEISDPQSYFAPDVVCDFSGVELRQIGPDRVHASGARGYPPTSMYKVCATYNEGWRGQVYQPIVGISAAAKARRQAEALFARTNRILRSRNAKPLNASHVEVIGAESSYGPRSRQGESREVVAMMTVDHDEREGVDVFLKEQICAISAMAPGTTMSLGGIAGRGVTPLMRVFNFLLPKERIKPVLCLDDQILPFELPVQGGYREDEILRPSEPKATEEPEPGASVPLIRLAWSRSGDKGNLFNVGVFARDKRFYPYIAAALSEEAVGKWFAHLVDDPTKLRVERFLLPGTQGLNFVLHESLGGGGSLCARLDPLAKTMGQILLEFPIPIPRALGP